VEPFFGGGQVLFARDPRDPRFWWDQRDKNGRKPQGVNEVVGDLNANLANFYAVLRDPEAFPEFFRRANLTQFDESTWEEARALLDAGGDRVTRAWALFICCRLSLAGRMKSFTGMTKVRLRRGMGNEVSAFLGAVEGLPEVHARLRSVQVLHRDGVRVLRDYDVPGTFAYCDPPYVPETRVSKQVYAHEMTLAQHRELLDRLLGLRHAKVILSGYPSQLYDSTLTASAGWQRKEDKVPNHSSNARQKERKTEVLWYNFLPAGVDVSPPQQAG
jgi:DNA adenine methylase